MPSKANTKTNKILTNINFVTQIKNNNKNNIEYTPSY
jgi:hypothetical protein